MTFVPHASPTSILGLILPDGILEFLNDDAQRNLNRTTMLQTFDVDLGGDLKCGRYSIESETLALRKIQSETTALIYGLQKGSHRTQACSMRTTAFASGPIWMRRASASTTAAHLNLRQWSSGSGEGSRMRMPFGFPWHHRFQNSSRNTDPARKPRKLKAIIRPSKSGLP